MRFISPFLKRVVYPGLSRSGCLRRHTRDTPVVLTYHGLLPPGYKTFDPVLDGNLVTPQRFRQHLQFLAKHYHMISPEGFLRWINGDERLPANSVLLTCDDGLRNNLTDMLPILQEFRLTCLFFVTSTGLNGNPAMSWCDEFLLMLLAGPSVIRLHWPDMNINLDGEGVREKAQSSWELVKHVSRFDESKRDSVKERLRDHLGLSKDWNAKYHDDPVLSRRFLTMADRELRELAASGMTIGAHTSHHPLLPRLSEELAWNEICENREHLQQILGQQIWAFAYPFGNCEAVTSREIKMAKNAGFTCAFINEDRGSVSKNRYSMPRIHVTAEMTMAELEAHLSGFHRSMRRALMPAPEIATAS